MHTSIRLSAAVAVIVLTPSFSPQSAKESLPFNYQS